MAKEKIRKILLWCFVGAISFTFIFYFLVGDQINYKDSNKNIVATDADGTSIELCEDVVFEQHFVNKLDKLESIAFIGHTYWRKNEGTLTVELCHGDDVLLKQTYDVNKIEDQHRTYLTIKSPLEGLLNEELTLKLYADSEEGKGICLRSYSNKLVGDLYINDQLESGSVCIATEGKEKIIFSDYYWPIMIGLDIAIGLLLFFSYRNYTKGKNNYLITTIFAIDRYKFLISQLVSRDFKTKYKRSVLGIFWSFLNPLLTMIVQFLVFSSIFNADTKSYPIYLLSGVVCFNFFKEVSDMSLVSISDNANLIKKVYIPKYIFPLAKTISSTINLGISLIPMFLLTLIMGIRLNAKVLLIIYFLFCLMVFALGVGMFLASLMVFFRDIKFIWTVIIQMWQYATPVFYTAEIIPEKYMFILRFNPLYHFIGNLRKCLMEGISPEPMAYVYCLLFALLSLAIGSIVFKKTQDKFTLYL